MTADILPSIFVPLTGVIMPAIAMAFLFIYIEREDASGI
jgi:photosystem I subunit 8